MKLEIAAVPSTRAVGLAGLLPIVLSETDNLDDEYVLSLAEDEVVEVDMMMLLPPPA